MEDFLLLLSRSGLHKDAATVSILVVTILAFLAPMIYVYPPFPPRESDALAETHSRIGLDDASGPPGTVSSSSGLPPSTATTTTPRIHSLYIYPVKSCAGIRLARSRVVPSGLEHDRLFTFAQLRSPFPVAVDADPDAKAAHRWEFITQRQFPRLATVQVELWRPDLFKCQRRGEKASESYLVLRFPWQEPGWRGALAWVAAKALRGADGIPEKEILLPVAFPSAHEIKDKDYEYDSVRIWKDTVTALNMRSELPDELQRYLGVSNKLGLFRIDPDRLREVYRCAPKEAEAGYQPVTGFQDAYPLHLLNLSSVEDFEEIITKDDNLSTLDPRRFRANIIISGPPAYEEEAWKAIKLLPQPGMPFDAAEFDVSCRTVRCKMPNVDQDTGFRHPVEPDKSLRQHRSVDEGAPRLGCLGMQLTPLFKQKGGRAADLESNLAVGMTVEVLRVGHHKYVPQ